MRTPLHIPIPLENSLKINLACEAPGQLGQFKLVCTLVKNIMPGLINPATTQAYIPWSTLNPTYTIHERQ